MTNKTYTWSVESVDLDSRTFVVIYTSNYAISSIRLNLPLPDSIDQTATVVESHVPRELDNLLLTQLSTTVNMEELLAQSGSATMIEPTPFPTAEQQVNTFNRRIAQSLVDLGVTQTNVYVAPEPADVTDTGAAPTVIS